MIPEYIFSRLYELSSSIIVTDTIDLFDPSRVTDNERVCTPNRFPNDGCGNPGIIKKTFTSLELVSFLNDNFVFHFKPYFSILFSP